MIESQCFRQAFNYKSSHRQLSRNCKLQTTFEPDALQIYITMVVCFVLLLVFAFRNDNIYTCAVSFLFSGVFWV